MNPRIHRDLIRNETCDACVLDDATELQSRNRKMYSTARLQLVHADRLQLQQVVLDILNAVAALSGRRHVGIRNVSPRRPRTGAAPRPGKARIRVRWMSIASNGAFQSKTDAICMHKLEVSSARESHRHGDDVDRLAARLLRKPGAQDGRT